MNKIELQQRIARLRDEQKTCHGRGKAIIARADAAGRDTTTAEMDELDKFHARFDAIDREVATLENQIADLDEIENSRPLPRVVPPFAPVNGGSGARQSYGAPTGPQYANLFRGAPGSDPYSGRFESFGSFALAVMSGKSDPRLISNSGMTEGSGAGGGYLVPPAFLANILDTALAIEAVRPNSRVLPMSSSTLDLPAFDFQDQTSGARAGLTLRWGGEAVALAEQTAVARKVSLSAKKANIFCRVSSELAEDAVAFDAQLSAAMASAIASGLDGVFVNGTGAGQPLGIMNSPALKVISKVTTPAQSTGTLFVTNLASMLAGLTPGSYARSTWLAHPTVIPHLVNLQSTAVGQASADVIGISTSNAVQFDANGNMKIFGRPVMFTDACAAFSSAGDILLCDLAQNYLIGVRRDAALEIDRSVFFASDELAFRMVLRIDGQPSASAPTKLRDGTLTVSPFVAMGAR